MDSLLASNPCVSIWLYYVSQPINGFGAPQRIYFLMQAPIHTFPSDYNDRDKCDRIYEEVGRRLLLIFTALMCSRNLV